MSDLDNLEGAQEPVVPQSQIVANTLNTAINGESGLTSSQIQAGNQAIQKNLDDEAQQQKTAVLAKQLQTTQTLFDPTNYATPVAPTNDKLTNHDYYPTTGQPLVHGSTSGKFFSTQIYGSQVVAPMAVIHARKQELERQAYAQQVRADQDKAKVLNWKPDTPPQFMQSFYDKGQLLIQEHAKKYNNNYSAMLRDPDFMSRMNKMEIASKSLWYIQNRKEALMKDAASKDKMINPELAKELQEFGSANGKWDSETAAQHVWDNKTDFSDIMGRLKTNDTMAAWSNMDNLKRFVKKVSDEQFVGSAKGMYSKSLKVGLSDQFLDKDSYMAGLKGDIKYMDVYDAGNPDAPEGTEDYNKWKKFSERQWEADQNAWRVRAKTQEVVENGKAAENANALAWSKFNKSNEGYFYDVNNLVTKNQAKDNLNIINSEGDWKTKKDKQKEILASKGLKTTDVLGLNTVSLPVTPHKIGYSSQDVRMKIPYSGNNKNLKGSWKLVSPDQYQNFINTNGDNYKIPDNWLYALKHAAKQKSVTLNVKYQGSTTMVRTANGLRNPYSYGKQAGDSPISEDNLANVVISTGTIDVPSIYQIDDFVIKNGKKKYKTGTDNTKSMESNAEFIVIQHNSNDLEHAGLSNQTKGIDAANKNYE